MLPLWNGHDITLSGALYAGQSSVPGMQVLKVDRSNGTVSVALALGQALVSSWGPIFGAECVLPVLSPCLAAPGLSREQFREVFKCASSAVTWMTLGLAYAGNASLTIKFEFSTPPP